MVSYILACLLVIEAISSTETREDVWSPDPVMLETTKKVCKVENEVSIKLEVLELVDLVCNDYATSSLPSAQTEANTHSMVEIVRSRKLCGW